MKVFTLTLRRREKEGAIADYPGNATPVAVQERAHEIAGALLGAEEKAGIRIDDTVPVTTRKSAAALDMAPRRERPIMQVGDILFREPTLFSRQDLEDIFLHELGHHHYTPVMRRFKDVLLLQNAAAGVQGFAAMTRDNASAMAARVTDYYQDKGGIDQFVDDVKTVREAAANFNASGMNSYAVGAMPDARMAALLLAAFEHEKRSGTMGPSPLAAWAEIAVENRNAFGASAARILISSQLEAPRVSIAEAGKHAGRIQAAVEAALPDCDACHATSRAIMDRISRGEEHLCDDFAVRRSSKPENFARVLGIARDRRKAKDVTPPEPGHPAIDDRIARCEALAERVNSHRELCGSLTQAVELEPEAYTAWVESRAAARTPSMPRMAAGYHRMGSQPVPGGL
jgi:hypothetical protein